MSVHLRNLLMTSTALLTLGTVFGTVPAGAQPTGPNVVGGSATVSGAGTNSVIVNQSSDRAIINWNTFNVSTGGSATFNQPGSSSITLNRVTGGLGPSVIDGTISANGRVFIINRDGMLFGKNAVVNTAGFLATTSDIRNADFMAGRMKFNIPGRGDASIVNYGNITASSGGFAALVAPGVRNTGTISANLGTVALASSNNFTLDMYGDRLIQIAVGDEIAGKVIDVATGKPLSSLVSNDGKLRANGGRVEITAAAARHVVDSVINNRGVIEANSVGTRGGKIVLGGATGATKKAGLPKQTIKISGTISATGKTKGSKGGTIQVTGEDIQFAAAMLDVSGHSGGGKILVGGDYGGGKPIPGGINNQSAVLEGTAIPTATTVTVDSATTFNASATANGHGGKVILWSDMVTTFAGTIFARGGDEGGNGGFVEVSGKQQLVFTGTVNTLAPLGQTGTLLLDPYNVTISNDPSSGTGFVANSENSVINAGTLLTALSTNNVMVSTGSEGDQAGNITVATGLTWTADTTLTLHAANNISIDAAITAVNGGLNINAGGGVTASGAINVGTFTLTNGAWIQNDTTLAAFHAKDFQIVGGSFLRVTGGNGSSENPYEIADVYGLQGIGSSRSFLGNGKHWQLVNDIDASGTANWNGDAGFKPIGNSEDRFSGSFAGEGFVIRGLTVASAQQHTGLFGYIGSKGSVDNLGLADVKITASGHSHSGWIGALAGQNDGSITRVYATGEVAANDTYYDVGGLVGRNDGTISQSYTDVATAGGAGSAIGGMAGRNYGKIGKAYSLGAVTAGNGSLAGGLVGWNVDSGRIVQTYATGRVSAGTGSQVGGLVGKNDIYASVESSYWDVDTTGQENSAGGGTGLLTANARNQANYSDLDFDGEGAAWFMIDGQTRPFLRMEWSETITNTHQLQLIAMNPDAHYKLANDIDFTNAFGAAGMWGTKGFAPIPVLYGSLNGAGPTVDGRYDIIGLKIAPNDATTQSIGLFGTLYGSVSNLDLVNATVTANTSFQQPVEGDPVSQWVGILAGQSGGTITNVTASGTVDGLSVVGVNAGGLVGQHGILGREGGEIAGTITGSSANVKVTVGDGDACTGSCMFNAAGGLVGVNVGGSTISNSQAHGTIIGGSRTWAGGLVGQNGFFFTAGAITGSWATGSVTVTGFDSAAGGLVGSNTWGSTIAGSHATGAVGGTGNVIIGGLVGENSGGVSNSHATGNVTLTQSGTPDAVAGGFVGSNQGTISESYATGHVSSTNGDVVLGGFAGSNEGDITKSRATGNVTATGATLAMIGGFVGGNSGDITESHATGNVGTNAALAAAGGFAGTNLGQIVLSFAKGTVAVADNSFAGGFVGWNSGDINQAYATGAISGGANSYVGGFVGLNLAFEVSTMRALSEASTMQALSDGGGFGSGSITDAYAIGATTGGNAAVVGGFAALNLGSLAQVYGVGQVQGGPGSTLGGLVGMNTVPSTFPDVPFGPPPGGTIAPGTATNAYWDMQTTGLTTSAGGVGMNSAALGAGLPAGFDIQIWGSPFYPFLLALDNPPNPPQDTNNPLPPVIPPVGVPGDPTGDPFLPPPDQQINTVQIGGPTSTTGDPIPNTTEFLQQQTAQQQRQAQQQQSSGMTTGSLGPQPIRLDVGENRYFYLPPPGETRLVVNEVVLQMPCDVPQATLDTIVKQHNLSVVASQCLQEGGGNAAFRMRHASNQTIQAVIRALAQHQIIAAAQANYLYTLAETKVQSATSQQGDPGQYVPEKLHLYAVHRLVRGANVPVAVIDSEIDAAHPDLKGTIANRYDATGVDDAPHAHGTGMAGAIVSHQRLLGVAPDARILAIRAFSTRAANSESTTYHILRGVDHAVANNVRIINMSFAGPRDPSLERAIKAAYDKGIVMIAAAGNAGPRSPALYPAADPNVIAVTATDIDDRLFTGANRGPHLAIAAPGVDILVPAPSGEYQVTTGTSVATAHISGVVALMLERNPKLTPADVRRILATSAKRLGPANQFGAGLVDPARAIEMAAPRSSSGPAAPAVAPKRTAATRP